MEEAYLRFLSGEMDAFDSIMTELHIPLIRFIQRYVKNVTVAEDLAEDSFVEILMHRERFNFKVKLKTYLFTIGRNKAIDYLRKSKRFVPFALEDEYLPVPLTQASPEDELLAKEQREKIVNMVREVKGDQGMALYLVLVEDLSHDEAARVMKKSRKQIENLLFQGRRKIRANLEQEEVLI